MTRMFFTALLSFMLMLILSDSVRGQSGGTGRRDECFTCHESLGDSPSEAFKHDIHRQKGVTCAGCHGGNPSSEDMEVAMGKAAGFSGVPKGDSISVRCATCHADAETMESFGSELPTNQWKSLQSSVHGKASITGKAHLAQCTTCHNSHGIVSVKDPSSPVSALNVTTTCAKCHSNPTYMQSYNPSLPIDQLDKYRTSMHGILNKRGDVKAAHCASCHGSHDIRTSKDVKSRVHAASIPVTCSGCHSDSSYMKEYGIPTDQYANFSKSVHGVALLEKKDVGAPACNDCHGNHGAMPPGVESISKVCGTCHALNADLFSESPHKKAFDDRKLPECETCHGNHEIVSATDALLGVTNGGVCARCHSEQENQKGFMVARTMRSLVDSLEFSSRHSEELLEEAEQKGMEVSEAKFKLRDARQSRLQSRTMVHSFNEAKFREVVSKGLTVSEEVREQGQHAVDEFYFRRWGLGVSTLIISIVAISLYATIRKIERRQKNSRK